MRLAQGLAQVREQEDDEEAHRSAVNFSTTRELPDGHVFLLLFDSRRVVEEGGSWLKGGSRGTLGCHCRAWLDGRWLEAAAQRERTNGGNGGSKVESGGAGGLELEGKWERRTR